MRTASCRCGRLTARCAADPGFPPPRHSVYAPPPWALIAGDEVEHGF